MNKNTYKNNFYKYWLYENLHPWSLPWYSVPDGDIRCDIPTANTISANSSSWHLTTINLNEIYNKQDDATTSKFENICMQLETEFSLQSSCSCCQGHRRGSTTKPCWLCDSKYIPIGWHRCAYDTRPVWHPGTLWAEEESTSEGYLLDLKDHGVKLENIRKKGEELVEAKIFTNEKLQSFLALLANDENLKVDTGELNIPENQSYVHENIEGRLDNSSRPTNAEERKAQKQKKLQVILAQLAQVWDISTDRYVHPSEKTSQELAFEWMCDRIDHAKLDFSCLHAGAGYGKSHLIEAFMLREDLQNRKWKKVAPSGVAAVNIGGITLHLFLCMSGDYEARIDDQPELIAELEETVGILIDEFGMVDVKCFHILERICCTYPLRIDLRKKDALPFFGYRSLKLVGDLFQVPPASGHPPLVVHPYFQTKCEFGVLQENRRQEKNPSYGKLLDCIKKGGGLAWDKVGAESCSGKIKDEVTQFFVNAYVRGFNISPMMIDFEVGVAMTSYC